MEIRPALGTDDAGLRALDASTWLPGVSPGPRPSGAAFFGPEDDPASTLVAVVDVTVAGYVKLGPPAPLASNGHVLLIRGLAVDPAHQRQGVASALVEAARQEGATRGLMARRVP
jgi:GNAT superfamily N-acetyltransferase